MMLAVIVVSFTMFGLAPTKATGKSGPTGYLTSKDFELGEKLRKVQQISSDMPLSAHLFEGDIAGIKDPKAYMEQLHAAMTQNFSNGHANAIKSPLKKWPNATIPYDIDGNVNAKARAAVASAIKEIQEKTCVKIVPRNRDNHYLSIETGTGGCSSNVGRIARRVPNQFIHLGHGCERHHTALHELMHTIGFHHEHSRHDRDQYLSINSSNIKKEFIFAFDVHREDATDLNTTFDYDSVMLYSNTAFSKNKQPTMVPKKSIGKKIGFAPHLSPNDVLKINLLYDCSTNGGQSAKGYKTGHCADSNVLCPTWKVDRQCERNSAWMKRNCRKTCGQC